MKFWIMAFFEILKYYTVFFSNLFNLISVWNFSIENYIIYQLVVYT